MLRRRQQFSNRPDVIGKTRFHGGGDSETRMHAAEIVVRKMQINSSSKILDLSRKGIRQAGEPAKLHSYGQVLPLHVTSRNVIGIGIAAANLGYNLRDLSWGVAFISLLAVVSVELRKLREVRVAAQRFLNRLPVEDVGVGGQLHAMVSDSAPNVTHESLRVLAGSLADQERGNQLRVRIQSDENPLVAKLCRIVLADMPRLLHQEGPYFIVLDTAAGKLTHLFVHQLLAAFASENQKPHDGIAVQAREAFCGSDRAAFKKALQRSRSSIRRCTHRAERRSGLRFTEGNVAGLAAPALDAALTKVPESLAGLVLASGAGHVVSPLAFCGETSQNDLGSEAWVAPRFGLVPASAETEAGTLNVSYDLGWWLDRDFHGLTGSGNANRDSDCHRCFILPESPVHAGLSHLGPKSLIALRNLSAQSGGHGFASPLVSRNSTSARLRLKHFLNFSSLFHSSDRGMDGGEKVGLRRQTQRLNSIANLDRKQRSIEGSEYDAASVGYPIHQPSNRKRFFARIGEFMQGSNFSLLSCNLGFKFLAVSNHLLQFASSFGKIGLVSICHRRIRRYV